MRIASNFSGDFLNFRAYVLESRMPWKEAVFETRLETTGNGTITIVRGERTAEQSKITAPVHVDRVPSSFPMRFHAFGWRGSQQWDNAQRVLLFETNVSGRWNEAKTFESARIENRWKIVCPSSMRRGTKKVAAGWTKRRRNFDHARLTVLKFPITAEEHLLSIYWNICCSNSFIIRPFSYLIIFCYLKNIFPLEVFLRIYIDTRALSLFPLDKRIFIWIYLFEMSQ